MPERLNFDESDLFLRYKDKNIFSKKETITECFNYFDKNKDTNLDITDFECILKKLFRFNGNSYYVSKIKIQRLFDCFKDELIDKIEFDGFEKFWNQIVKRTLFPRSALVIVDVQNDFISGTLSLKNCPSGHNGEEVVPVINKLIQDAHFNTIAYTLDWHPENHCSFIENISMRKLSDISPTKNHIQTFDTVIFEDNPKVLQKLWPAHCITNTHGAELHINLKQVDPTTDPLKRKVFYAKKGTQPDVDSYSAFFNTHSLKETELHTELQSEGITDLYICGLAYDICVACTAFDALMLKYRVVIVEDACRGVDVAGIRRQRNSLINRGALVVDSRQVNDMINCNDRRPEFLTSFLLSQ